MTDRTARLDQLAAEIRTKTDQGTAAHVITELAAALGDQTCAEFPNLDQAAVGALLMDAAIRLQVMVTHTDYRMTSQTVVSILAAAGERLYTQTAAGHSPVPADAAAPPSGQSESYASSSGPQRGAGDADAVARAEAAEALELLHARIHRDFNFDASESAAPDDEYWARLMDDLVRYADEIYLPIADAAKGAPAEAACKRCHIPFAPADKRYDGHAEEPSLPGYCRSCVDHCHDSEDAFHRCVICDPPKAVP